MVWKHFKHHRFRHFPFFKNAFVLALSADRYRKFVCQVSLNYSFCVFCVLLIVLFIFILHLRLIEFTKVIMKTHCFIWYFGILVRARNWTFNAVSARWTFSLIFYKIRFIKVVSLLSSLSTALPKQMHHFYQWFQSKIYSFVLQIMLLPNKAYNFAEYIFGKSSNLLVAQSHPFVVLAIDNSHQLAQKLRLELSDAAKFLSTAVFREI